MNYYDALKLSDGSGYHYVSQNRRSGTHPVGYCSRIWPCPECGDFGKADCEACCGKGYIEKDEQHVHATADEARECFRTYLMDGWREVEYGDWRGCEYLVPTGESDDMGGGIRVKCDKPTKKGLTSRPPLGHGYALCDEHCTYENLDTLTPSVGQITASY